MNFLFVVVHAILWAFMEVEIEGTRGWMYDSQTQCSGIFAFTWYHIIMNILAILTIVHINHYRNWIWTMYQILTWFIVEDVTWFVINGINYRTAPWQTTYTAVISTVLPFLFMCALQPRLMLVVPVLVQIAVTTYIWTSFGTDYNRNTTYTPRNNYCL